MAPSQAAGTPLAKQCERYRAAVSLPSVAEMAAALARGLHPIIDFPGPVMVCARRPGPSHNFEAAVMSTAEYVLFTQPG